MNYEVLKDCRFDIREYKIYGQWKCFKGLLSIDFDPGDIIITPGNVRYISLWLLMLKNIVLRKNGLLFLGHTHGMEKNLGS